jgi:hypothetical protein
MDICCPAAGLDRNKTALAAKIAGAAPAALRIAANIAKLPEVAR